MGMFSWVKSDDEEAITNNSSPQGAAPCKMLAPDGRVWEEPDYEGYGVFGGKDFYDLLGELNGLDKWNSFFRFKCKMKNIWSSIKYRSFYWFKPLELRSVAISYCATKNGGIMDDADHIIYPKLVSLDCEDSYEDLPNSESDENQGFGFEECNSCGEREEDCTCYECDICGYHEDDCCCDEEEEEEED